MKVFFIFLFSFFCFFRLYSFESESIDWPKLEKRLVSLKNADGQLEMEETAVKEFITNFQDVAKNIHAYSLLDQDNPLGQKSYYFLGDNVLISADGKELIFSSGSMTKGIFSHAYVIPTGKSGKFNPSPMALVVREADSKGQIKSITRTLELLSQSKLGSIAVCPDCKGAFCFKDSRRSFTIAKLEHSLSELVTVNPFDNKINFLYKLKIAIGGAEALDKLHRQVGFTHRDVKEANMTFDPKTHKVHLIDFETARKTGDSSSFIAGTFYYLSPDCADTPCVVQAESDVWSYAKTLLSLLCGKTFRIKESITNQPELKAPLHSDFNNQHDLKNAFLKDYLFTLGLAKHSLWRETSLLDHLEFPPIPEKYDPDGRLTTLLRNMLLFRPENRPSMKAVKKELAQIHKLIQRK